MDNPELELDTWGTGASHALAWSDMIGEVCPRCDGNRWLPPTNFPVPCPVCKGTGKVLEREVPDA